MQILYVLGSFSIPIRVGNGLDRPSLTRSKRTRERYTDKERETVNYLLHIIASKTERQTDDRRRRLRDARRETLVAVG